MSLEETLPWAIVAGNNAGEAKAMRESRDAWRDYARNLEKQVKFYRAEAINGWAAYEATKEFIINNFGQEPKEIPEIMSRVPALKKKQAEFYDNQ